MRRLVSRIASSSRYFGFISVCVAGLFAVPPAPVVLPLPGHGFRIENSVAFIIPPPHSTVPIQWVWYAPTLQGRYPGQEEKWMFERFVAAGIAIVGIDIGESYGSPQGRERYSKLYEYLVHSLRYSPKPVLLARSRGGLQLLNWAADHPDKVAALAGIYPVFNLASYPGLAKAAPAYGLTVEHLTSELAQHNPIDRLAALAAARIPLFAIHGDADKLVPLDQNSAVVRDRYVALGGDMTLVVPPGQGHSMWPGFFESEELVAFVLRHARN